jgi:hypothetical protein
MTATTDSGNYKFGFGHQKKADQKAIEACEKSLVQAFGELALLQSDEAFNLQKDIDALVTRCKSLSYAMNERFNQNV